MPRLTKDQWEAARLQWEADPTLTFEALGKELGVSKQAVASRAKAENWERDTSLKDIARLAHLKADKRELVHKVDGQVDEKSIKRAAKELATDIRADVIKRHRADWAEDRMHYQTSDIAADFDLGKSAKISAEMLAIRQKAERGAYGLDTATDSEVITIDRSYGVKP